MYKNILDVEMKYHVIFTILSCGLWLIVYFYCKSKYEQEQLTKLFYESYLNDLKMEQKKKEVKEEPKLMIDEELLPYLQRDAEFRKEHHHDLVIIVGHNCCPACAPWDKIILIDDVFCEGKPDGKHLLLSDAIKKGLLHKGCICSICTYYPEVEDINRSYDNYSYNMTETSQKLSFIYEKYKDVFDKHHKYKEEIGVSYAVARYSDIDSPEFEECIKLCYEDISLVKDIFNYNKEYKKILRNDNLVQTYNSFKQLAILLEKAKRYNEAIEVCQTAINYGFVNDGTNGKMFGRLARLKSKTNKYK